MKALAKDLAEMIGVGKPGRASDLLDRLLRVQQAPRRLFQTDLLDELGWPKPGSGLERVAEMAATHALDRG